MMRAIVATVSERTGVWGGSKHGQVSSGVAGVPDALVAVLVGKHVSLAHAEETTSANTAAAARLWTTAALGGATKATRRRRLLGLEFPTRPSILIVEVGHGALADAYVVNAASLASGPQSIDNLSNPTLAPNPPSTISNNPPFP